MTNTTTTRLHKRVSNKPIFHNITVQLEAVSRVNQLMRDGLSQTQALKKVSGPLNISSQTVQNWRHKHNLVKISSNRTNGNRTMSTPLVTPVTTDHTYAGRFGIQSVNLMTTDGINIKLTVKDLKEIAKIAGSFC